MRYRSALYCGAYRVVQVLDLFAGIGGLSLGLERAGFSSAAFCEIDPFAQKVLAKNFPGVPCYDDVTTLTADRLISDGVEFDVIAGGYPCQPFSSAGLQQGDNDPRHLWPHMLRLIRECRPKYVVAENVEGHVQLGMQDVCRDLESENYRVWSFVIPASATGARHLRNRVFIVGQRHAQADPSEDGWQCDTCNREVFNGCECDHGERLCSECGEWTYPLYYEMADGCSHCGADWDVPHTHGERGCDGTPGLQDANHAGQPPQRERYDQEGIESRVDRVVDGFPGRVDRLRTLGNAVSPPVAEMLGQAIKTLDSNNPLHIPSYH